jgi:hypothetical protein
MKRSDINPLPKYFDRYINLADDIELHEALKNSLAALDRLPVDKWKALGDQVYAPGKWTVKDMIQHLIDTERIFAYRALRFARKDTTQLAGFEENDYAAAADAGKKSLDELVDEMKTVRKSTVFLFAAFDDEVQARMGSTPSAEISVASLGFAIVGHELHHFRILEERYFPLLG